MFRHNLDDTGTAYLSLFASSDAAALYQLIDRNREHLGAWLRIPEMTLTEEDSRSFIERTRLRYAREEGYWLGIWLRGELAGSIGYCDIDYMNRKAEIGYWLGKEYEGNGLITTAVNVFIQHAFEGLSLNKVEIGAAADNWRSRAIPEKLGFQQEGELRDYEFLKGRFLHRVMYGLRAEEWTESIK
ncbi:GNAT family N-acetyltransferase [Paenibacillus barcinonensis]|uniref:GNAT family N-acetyltransferase n=1 Tax=Paenibacillus barcinonensis TaxID=198119 RepID=UPI001C0F992B|nr:GNAT family protein [Paenibacillus barcinonensis]MBU5352068.1 GNAT family N-acetyltransferase [Paenibacillus barcinonensis]